MTLLLGLIGLGMIIWALNTLHNLQEEPKVKIKFLENYVHLCYFKDKKGSNKLYLNGKEIKLKKGETLEQWICSDNLYNYSETI